MLTYWTLYFRNTEKIINTIDNTRIWHGIFFNILKQYNEELAEKYHSQASKQQFSISPIYSENCRNKKYFNKGELLKINLSLLIEEMYFGLFDFIKNNPIINFANGYLQIEEITCRAITNEVLEEEKITRGVLKFLSPTTFRVNPLQYPLPDPNRIFNSLNKSYKDCFNGSNEIGKDLVFDDLERNIIIESVRISTETACYKDFRINGFCGNVNLKIKHSDVVMQKYLEKLFALASYIGIGYKTGMGMGQCIALKY